MVRSFWHNRNVRGVRFCDARTPSRAVAAGAVLRREAGEGGRCFELIDPPAGEAAASGEGTSTENFPDRQATWVSVTSPVPSARMQTVVRSGWVVVA